MKTPQKKKSKETTMTVHCKPREKEGPLTKDKYKQLVSFFELLMEWDIEEKNKEQRDNNGHQRN